MSGRSAQSASSPPRGEVGPPREAQPSGSADRVRGKHRPLIASLHSALLPEGEKTPALSATAAEAVA